METQSIGEVLSVIDQPAHEKQEQKLGPQIVITIDNEVVHHDSDGNLVLPETHKERLEKLRDYLHLTNSDTINTKSNLKHWTLLMAAIKFNDFDSLVILLNHGADPSITDDDGNNAFIHAAKRGRMEMLRELLTLIQTEEQKKQKKVTQLNEKKSQESPVKQNVASLDSKVNQALAATEKSHKPAKQIDIKRVPLDVNILTQTTGTNMTLVSIVENLFKKWQPVVENPPTPSTKAQKLKHEKVKKITDPLAFIKSRIDQLISLKKVQVSAKPVSKPTENIAPQRPYEIKPDAADIAYKSKIEKVTHLYDGFFTRQYKFFLSSCVHIAWKFTDLRSVKQREQIRSNKIIEDNAGDKTPARKLAVIPIEMMPAGWPSDIKDQAQVRSALSILKDYYAPINAPLPHSIESPMLRRMLTFHMGRRYYQQAEELYNQLNCKPLATVEDILEIISIAEKHSIAIKEHRHDMKKYNNIFNSSYTRRLDFMVRSLKQTKAYIAQKTMNKESYIEDLDNSYRLLKMI